MAYVAVGQIACASRHQPVGIQAGGVWMDGQIIYALINQGLAMGGSSSSF